MSCKTYFLHKCKNKRLIFKMFLNNFWGRRRRIISVKSGGGGARPQAETRFLYLSQSLWPVPQKSYNLCLYQYFVMVAVFTTHRCQNCASHKHSTSSEKSQLVRFTSIDVRETTRARGDYDGYVVCSLSSARSRIILSNQLIVQGLTTSFVG